MCIYLFLCLAVFADKPNVILIVADDMGSKGLACFGGKYLETPNLDKLCQQGMKFTDGLSCYPTCKPSRAAILSGQYGSRTGVHRVSDKHKGLEQFVKYKVPENGVLKTETIIIPELFKRAGYTTAMFGKWHVSNNGDGHPKNHGFDEAIVSAGAHYKFQSVPQIDVPESISSAEVFTDKAEEFMEKAVKENKPFFLYMPYFLVHRPMTTKKEYIEYFKKKMGDEVEDDEIPILAGMTKLLDECCGRLFSKINSLGIEDNTLIIFTSDNGAFKSIYNGELNGQKGDTYEGGLQVPYIFKWKGKIKSGTQANDRITGVDLFPTFLDLLKLETEQLIDGISLLPLLSGEQNTLLARPVICHFPKYARYSQKSQKWIKSWRNVMYLEQWKIIEYPEYGEYELFDLKQDKLERNNLASKKPEVLRSMKKMLHAKMKDIEVPNYVINENYQLSK